MKILIVADEVWNDIIFGNNVLTNWFDGFDAEFAEIYCSPGLPYNNVCNTYFQVTDADMAKSLIGGPKAGKNVTEFAQPDEVKQEIHPGIYSVLKKISMHLHTPMMMLRDAIWTWGRYNKAAMKKFIDDFNPDVIFSPRRGTPKLFRLERIISEMSYAPIVAFTGDNETFENEYSLSPLFRIRRWYTRRSFKKNIGIYRKYLMHSGRQAKEYNLKFGLDTGLLFKCAGISEITPTTPINEPITLVYAGRLYCNRWKTLAEIGKALKEINADGVRMILNIYTTDLLNKKQKEFLNEANHIYVKGAVAPDKLREIYGKADIALHVESMDRANRLSTQYSFSTKIIDLLASGCAVMAICWEKQCGLEYLKTNDAAICISDYCDIEKTLRCLIENPNIILKYKTKAQRCALDNHEAKSVKTYLHDTFTALMKKI